MLRRKTCIWPVVAAAMWTGCAFGPLGSYRTVSPVDYEGLAHLSAAPKSLTGTEIDTLWIQLGAEDPELAAQSAGTQSYAWCVVCKDTFKYPQHSQNVHGEGSGNGGGARLCLPVC